MKAFNCENQTEYFFDLAQVIKIIIIMNSKFRELEQSSISKFATTQRKSTRTPLLESTLDRDFQLERQYLDKLKVQRIKTQKLFEEYTTATKQLKKERENTAKLKIEVQQLRERILSLEVGRTEAERWRIQAKSLQSQCEQQKREIQQLMADKSTLIKKFKEAEGQLTSLQSLRLQLVDYRMQVQQLQGELEQANKQLKLTSRQHQQELQSLKQRNLQLQRSASQAGRQLKKQKQLREAQRIKGQQDLQRWKLMMMEKTSAFEKLINDFELDMSSKKQSFEARVSQLQKMTKYWQNKYEQKSHETHQLKKTAQEHRESVRRGKQELEAVHLRLQEKQRKYETLYRDLTECYSNIRHKEEELVRIQKSLQATTAAGERQSGRLRELQEENEQLRQWMQQYYSVMEQRRQRELQHKELLEDQLQEISKFEKIFKSIE